MSRSTTLALYQGDRLARTREWTNLHDDELRRRAVHAAGAKDVDALVSLTTAYLDQQGASGILTSRRTVEAYTLGTRQFLEYATGQAVNLLRPGRHDAQNYINHLLAAGRKPAGVQLKVAAASCLYRALRWAGATEADPFRDAKVPKDRTPGLVKRPPYSEPALPATTGVCTVRVARITPIGSAPRPARRSSGTGPGPP